MRSWKLIIILFLFLFVTQQKVTKQCHYSCFECVQNSYDRCISCNDEYKFTHLLSQPMNGTDSNQKQLKLGICEGHIPLPFNPLGIIMLVLYVLVYLIKTNKHNNQIIIVLISWLQSLSMISFIPIPFIGPLSFLLQSLTSFMPVSMLSKTYKINTQSQLLLENHHYRLEHFLKSQEIEKNILILGPVICMIVLYIVLIPLFLYVRKWLCGQDTCRKFSEYLLRQVEKFFYVLYFFIVQETYLVLFVGLKYTESRMCVVFTVVFVLSNVFMMVNYWIKGIPEFPNKKVLFLHIVEKILLPFMVIFGSDIYMISTPTILFLCRLIQIKLNDKDYNMKSIQKRKYFGYLLVLVVIIFLTGGLIVLERVVKNSTGVSVLSIIISVVIVLLLLMSMFVQVLQLVQVKFFYTKGMSQQLQKRRNQLIMEQQLSSLAIKPYENKNKNKRDNNLNKQYHNKNNQNKRNTNYSQQQNNTQTKMNFIQEDTIIRNVQINNSNNNNNNNNNNHSIVDYDNMKEENIMMMVMMMGQQTLQGLRNNNNKSASNNNNQNIDNYYYQQSRQDNDDDSNEESKDTNVYSTVNHNKKLTNLNTNNNQDIRLNTTYKSNDNITNLSCQNTTNTNKLIIINHNNNKSQERTIKQRRLKHTKRNKNINKNKDINKDINKIKDLQHQIFHPQQSNYQHESNELNEQNDQIKQQTETNQYNSRQRSRHQQQRQGVSNNNNGDNTQQQQQVYEFQSIHQQSIIYHHTQQENIIYSKNNTITQQLKINLNAQIDVGKEKEQNQNQNKNKDEDKDKDKDKDKDEDEDNEQVQVQVQVYRFNEFNKDNKDNN